MDIRAYEHLVGKPYKRGCLDGTAFDCWTLVRYIYQLNNITLPKNLLARWSRSMITAKMRENEHMWKPVPFKDKSFLDILLFHTTYQLSTHVGLVLSGRYFIHAHSQNGVIIEKFTSGFSASLINKVYRWQQ